MSTWILKVSVNIIKYKWIWDVCLLIPFFLSGSTRTSLFYATPQKRDALLSNISSSAPQHPQLVSSPCRDHGGPLGFSSSAASGLTATSLKANRSLPEGFCCCLLPSSSLLKRRSETFGVFLQWVSRMFSFSFKSVSSDCIVISKALKPWAPLWLPWRRDRWNESSPEDASQHQCLTTLQEPKDDFIPLL